MYNIARKFALALTIVGGASAISSAALADDVAAGDVSMPSDGNTVSVTPDAGDDVTGTTNLSVDGQGAEEIYNYNQSGGDGVTGGPIDGGNSGNIDATVTGEALAVNITNEGGDAAAGGSGGNAGDINAEINGNIANIQIESNGGDALAGGVGGNAGDVTVTLEGTNGTIVINANGGVVAGGADGQSGNITLNLNGEIDNAYLQNICAGLCVDNAGTVTVVLGDDAKVNGVISNVSGRNGTLVFNMEVTEAEYTSASAALQHIQDTGQMSGTVTINGNTISWDGFAQLQNELQKAAVNNPNPEPGNPNTPVKVTYDHNDSSEPASQPTQKNPVTGVLAGRCEDPSIQLAASSDPYGVRLTGIFEGYSTNIGIMTPVGFLENPANQGWDVVGLKLMPNGYYRATIANPAGDTMKCTLGL